MSAQREYTDKLIVYHSGLLLGNPALRLRSTRGEDPAQDALLTQADSDAWELLNTSIATRSELLRRNVASQGLDYLVTRFIDASNGFLARFEPWLADDKDWDRVYKRYGSNLTENWEGLNLVPPRDKLVGVDYSRSYGHNLSRINADPGFRELEEMGFELLDKKLAKSVDLYLSYTKAAEASSTVVQVAVFVLNIVIIAVLQYGVFKRQFGNLEAEAQRTQELLRLVPAPVLDSMPRSIKTFLGRPTGVGGAA